MMKHLTNHFLKSKKNQTDNSLFSDSLGLFRFGLFCPSSHIGRSLKLCDEDLNIFSQSLTFCSQLLH